jgi:RNA polymerase sigma-70 factor (ECF subfamily)
MSAEEFAVLRPLLFSIGYRMLASVSEAEDVVQDAFLRYQRALSDGVEIESPKAYLSAVVTRLAIDQLRSARNRRENYFGEWLPEPLLTDGDDPARAAEEADSLSMAFLLLLERLSPVERAVFLLHDVFAFDYDEIGSIVNKSAVNCRQLASRARRHIEADKPRYETSKRERDELAARFFAAMTDGDVDGLVTILAEDVVVYGDGGGKAPQWSQPIVGPQRVARLFAGLGRQLRLSTITVELRDVNGQPGAVLRTRDGELINVFALDIIAGVVQTVRSVINPDKLRHLGSVADTRALLRDARQAKRKE